MKEKFDHLSKERKLLLKSQEIIRFHIIDIFELKLQCYEKFSLPLDR